MSNRKSPNNKDIKIEINFTLIFKTFDSKSKSFQN